MIEVLSRMRLPIAPQLPDEVARKADIITGESVNYSISPVDTGVMWIDGQPIYRRVFILMTGATVNTSNTILHVPNGWGFFGLVRLDGYLTTTDEDRVPLSYYFAPNDYLGVRITGEGDVIERHGGASMNQRPMIVIIDYISQPIGTSSWDQGTTAWDNGTSTWDQLDPQHAYQASQWDGGQTVWR